MTRRTLWAVALLLVLALPAVAGTGGILVVNASSVYIDRGAADGLREGDVVAVQRDGQEIGTLQVAYAATHSSSCTVLASTASFASGDRVGYRSETPIATDLPQTGKPKLAMAGHGDGGLNLHGTLAAEWRSFTDDSEAGEDFTQPAFAAHIDGDNLWGRPLDLRLRVRSKYSQRSREIDEERPQDEWLHRVYEAALVWNCPKFPYRLSAGRLYNGDLPGAGNWDGLEFQYNFGPRWSAGALSGYTPGLINSAFDKDKQTYGAYLLFHDGALGDNRYRGSLGWVGQYDGHVASREFINMRNTIQYEQLSVYQTLEFDMNRDWREEAQGESSTLSRLNAGMIYRVTLALRLRLSYDRWDPVRDLYNREIPDSLYTLTLQQGLKAGASLRVTRQVTVGASVGYRDKESEDKRPVFFNGDLSVTDLAGSGVNAQARYAYADGRFTRTQVPSLDLQRRFGHALDLGLGFGVRNYEGVEAESALADQSSSYVRVYGGYRLSREVSLQGIYGHTGGDVGAGNLVQLRLAYRL